MEPGLGWGLVGAEVGIATVALVSGWVLLGMGDEALTLLSIRGSSILDSQSHMET